MSSELQFATGMFVIFIIWFVWIFWGKSFSEIKTYFKTDTGKGIAKGIVAALVITLVFVFLPGCSSKFDGTYFNYASVYAGLDRLESNKNSICQNKGIDDLSTSNLGVRGNLYESADRKFDANLKFTHHSCAFSPDGYGYDGIGVELNYKFWER